MVNMRVVVTISEILWTQFLKKTGRGLQSLRGLGRPRNIIPQAALVRSGKPHRRAKEAADAEHLEE
jgi:hypothetical protein